MVKSVVSFENTFGGWLPAQFVIESGEISFLWMDFSGIDISEPFFRQTLARMADLGNKTQTTSMQDLILIGSRMPAIRPSCLIFHVSRCGSTLLANALRAGCNCVALSEPKIITDLFHFCNELPAPAQRLRDSILQSVVNLYTNYQGIQRNVIIKLASWNLLSLHGFRKLWPDTPCILLIRHPGEVIISNLKPGGWLNFRSNPRCASRLLELDEMQVARMSDMEFCARVIERLNEAALECIDAKMMILDYNMIDVGLMATIAEFIGFDKAKLDWNAVKSMFQVYSKDQNGIRAFEDDRAVKRSQAAQLITGSSAELATNSYNLLLRRALNNFPGR
jgi:hypothetical protein